MLWPYLFTAYLPSELDVLNKKISISNKQRKLENELERLSLVCCVCSILHVFFWWHISDLRIYFFTVVQV